MTIAGFRSPRNFSPLAFVAPGITPPSTITLSLPTSDESCDPSYVSQMTGSRLNYEIDWLTLGLENDSIATSTWTYWPAGLVLSSPSNTTTTTSIWFAGGAAQETYAIVNWITTIAGKIIPKVVYLSIC